jgi:phosphate uptake regulator
MLTSTLPMQFTVELKREKNLLKLDFDINSNIRRLNNIVQNIIIDLASCIAGYEKSKEVKNVNEFFL